MTLNTKQDALLITGMFILLLICKHLFLEWFPAHNSGNSLMKSTPRD